MHILLPKGKEYLGHSIHSVLLEMCDLADIVYFSARKVTSSRGGAICTNNIDLFNKMRHLVPLYEGFLTYGGISIRDRSYGAGTY